MISAVVYNSLTGSCEKYAQLLSAALHVPAVKLGGHVRAGGKVLYIGWSFAGKVVSYEKAAKKYDVVGLVQVGMSPGSEKNVSSTREKHNIPRHIKVFSVQGGFHMDKLPAPMRFVMKIKNKEIAARISKIANPSPAELATLKMAQTGEGEPAQWSIDEIVAWAR